MEWPHLWGAFADPLPMSMEGWLKHGDIVTSSLTHAPCTYTQSTLHDLIRVLLMSCVTDRKHCITDCFLYYVIVCINTVCMCVLFSCTPRSSSLLSYTCTYLQLQERGQRRQQRTRLGVPGPLAEASESIGLMCHWIVSEHGITHVTKLIAYNHYFHWATL